MEKIAINKARSLENGLNLEAKEGMNKVKTFLEFNQKQISVLTSVQRKSPSIG